MPTSSTPTVSVSNWKPLSRNTMRGFVTVSHPSGLVIHEVIVHTNNGTSLASPPARPMIGNDGTPLREPNGKLRYQRIVSFVGKPVGHQWSDAVIAALRLAYPEALS